MYEKVSTNLNFVDREKKTEEFWKENDIFRKSTKSLKIRNSGRIARSFHT